MVSYNIYHNSYDELLSQFVCGSRSAYLGCMLPAWGFQLVLTGLGFFLIQFLKIVTPYFKSPSLLCIWIDNIRI